jgi:hypothetical protein
MEIHKSDASKLKVFSSMASFCDLGVCYVGFLSLVLRRLFASRVACHLRCLSSRVSRTAA